MLASPASARTVQIFILKCSVLYVIKVGDGKNWTGLVRLWFRLVRRTGYMSAIR